MVGFLKRSQASPNPALFCVIGLASHCAKGQAEEHTHTHTQTHHYSPLCCLSVDSWFNRIQRTMSRGYKRSGGKTRKKLSLLCCPDGDIQCIGSGVHTHTHTLDWSAQISSLKNWYKQWPTNSRFIVNTPTYNNLLSGFTGRPSVDVNSWTLIFFTVPSIN